MASSFRAAKEAWLNNAEGHICMDRTVIAKMTSVDTAKRMYDVVKQPWFAAIRGLLTVIGVIFAFLSLLDITPPWTAILYTIGLAPEIILTTLFIDRTAYMALQMEFEFNLIVLSVLVFSVVTSEALGDLRAFVPMTIFVVMWSSQSADVSYPYVFSKLTDFFHSFAGCMACLALYTLFQMGWVPRLTMHVYDFSQVTGKSNVTITNIQFACDRIITAAFFLGKQSFSILYRANQFIALRQSIVKVVEGFDGMDRMTNKPLTMKVGGGGDALTAKVDGGA
jgi:hypothetical protein